MYDIENVKDINFNDMTDVDTNCKWCSGYGKVNIGNICSGFGGKLGPFEECMCITYKKIGFKQDEEGEWYNPKKVTGGFINEPIDLTKPTRSEELNGGVRR